METHSERSKKASRPCEASHMTFGGRCLNCGFGEPKVTGTVTPAKHHCPKCKGSGRNGEFRCTLCHGNGWDYPV